MQVPLDLFGTEMEKIVYQVRKNENKMTSNSSLCRWLHFIERSIAISERETCYSSTDKWEQQRYMKGFSHVISQNIGVSNSRVP